MTSCLRPAIAYPSRAATVSLALLLVSSAAISAADWSQWRGAQRDGTSPGEPWPVTFGGLEESWSVPLGKGYPGPVSNGGRIFVVETVDNKTEQVRALDLKTGEELWRHGWEGSGSVPFYAKKNGDWVRSTPAVAEDGLFVGGMEEVLRKLDPMTGTELWAVDFPQLFDTKIPDFGFASSPLLDGDGVIVQASNSVVRLDRKTGAVQWRSLQSPGTVFESGAFSSPVLADLAGRRQLLVQSRETLHGLDPSTGEVLWSQDVPHFRGMNILTPVVVGEDRVLTSSYRNQTYLYRVVAQEGGEAATPYRTELVWQHKAHAYMSSPVVRDGYAYLHLGNSRFTCIDLETGESTWTSTPFGDYWSVALRDDLLLALDASGELLLIRLQPEKLEVLERREVVKESAWGHLAVVEDQIFVRGLESLTALRWKPASPPTTSAADTAAR